MKIVRANQIQEFKNSEACIALEYPLGDTDINGTVVKLSGRYPDNGYVTNEVCKELVYVLRGSGSLVVGGETQELREGDLVLLLPGEKYYFEGSLDMFMPCTPAWYPEQHKPIAS